ncbi:hypothetical protein Q3G72_021932 [Acer saccharum]|nr:hypothetical protein Q3G72_021932 [Acer saccharum]
MEVRGLEDVYSTIEFTLIRTPEEKSKPPDALPSSYALGSDVLDKKVRSTSVEKSSHEWKLEEDDNILDEEVYSPVEFTLIRTLEEKSESSNALPSYALGSDVLDNEVYSPVEFTLIWTPEEKLEPPDVLPSDAFGFCTTIVAPWKVTDLLIHFNLRIC